MARQRARELANTPEFSTAQRQRKKVEALFAELRESDRTAPLALTTLEVRSGAVLPGSGRAEHQATGAVPQPADNTGSASYRLAEQREEKLGSGTRSRKSRSADVLFQHPRCFNSYQGCPEIRLISDTLTDEATMFRQTWGWIPAKLNIIPSQYPCWLTVIHPHPSDFPTKLLHGLLCVTSLACAVSKSARPEVQTFTVSSSSLAATERKSVPNPKTTRSKHPLRMDVPNGS